MTNWINCLTSNHLIADRPLVFQKHPAETQPSLLSSVAHQNIMKERNHCQKGGRCQSFYEQHIKHQFLMKKPAAFNRE